MIEKRGDPMSRTSHLCSALISRSRERPDSTFVTMVSRRDELAYSNRFVLNRALDMGDALAAKGVEPGSLVIIVLDHRIDLYTTFLGCMIRGFVPSFLPPLTTKQDVSVFRRSMSALFARIEPKAVIVSDVTLPHVPTGTYLTIIANEIPETQRGELSGSASSAINCQRIDERSTAFLQHSSGTTGLKKGVMISHRAALEHVNKYASSIHIEAHDVVASWLPLYHDMGLVTSFLLPAAMGNPIVSMDALDWVMRPTMLLDAIERHRAAFCWLPNFSFHHIVRAAPESAKWDLRSLKAIISCSEPCRTKAFDLFAERFDQTGINRSKLQVSYAMAENVFAVTQSNIDQCVRSGQSSHTRAFLSCGRPLPGVDIRIEGLGGEEPLPGQPGEICIRSSTLFEGYFRQPEVTADRIRDGWFHTNDLGCLEDGELFVLGRVDDLLIVNGRNLFAHELEEQLSVVPGVAPGRVLACTEFEPKLGATRLIILAEPLAKSANSKLMGEHIRRITLDQTGLLPSTIQFLPRGFLVKSSSGKIARIEKLPKIQRIS